MSVHRTIDKEQRMSGKYHMIGRFSHQPLDPMLGAMVIKAVDTPGFANAVLTAANRLNGAVEVFAYRAGENGRPQALFSASLSQSFVERSERYAGGFYRNDPVAHARHNLAQGSGFTRQVTATEILRGDYREICFDRPGFVEWQS